MLYETGAMGSDFYSVKIVPSGQLAVLGNSILVANYGEKIKLIWDKDTLLRINYGDAKITSFRNYSQKTANGKQIIYSVEIRINTK